MSIREIARNLYELKRQVEEKERALEMESPGEARERPLPTLALKSKKKYGSLSEDRYRLWSTDASGMCIEVIVAQYPEYGVWRCVTAFPVCHSTKKAYLRRLGT